MPSPTTTARSSNVRAGAVSMENIHQATIGPRLLVSKLGTKAFSLQPEDELDRDQEVASEALRWEGFQVARPVSGLRRPSQLVTGFLHDFVSLRERGHELQPSDFHQVVNCLWAVIQLSPFGPISQARNIVGLHQDRCYVRSVPNGSVFNPRKKRSLAPRSTSKVERVGRRSYLSRPALRQT